MSNSTSEASDFMAYYHGKKKPKLGSGEPPMNLEARVDKLEQDVSNIRADVSAIKERLNHMPTTAQMLWAGVGAVGFLLVFMASGFGWLYSVLS